MKLLIAVLGVFLAGILLSGCTHAPKAFAAKSPTDQALVAYAKTKAPDLIVVNVEAPPMSQVSTGSVLEYTLTLASANDDSMTTKWKVSIDVASSRVLDQQANPTPGPLVKGASASN